MPPTTDVGFNTRVERTGGVIVTVAVLEELAILAVKVLTSFVDTEAVLMVKAIEVFPAGTVTDDGTVMALDPLDKITGIPPTGAPPVRVTVPEIVAPPVTTLGLTLRRRTKTLDRNGFGATTSGPKPPVNAMRFPDGDRTRPKALTS